MGTDKAEEEKQTQWVVELEGAFGHGNPTFPITLWKFQTSKHHYTSLTKIHTQTKQLEYLVGNRRNKTETYVRVSF